MCGGITGFAAFKFSFTRFEGEADAGFVISSPNTKPRLDMCSDLGPTAVRW